MRLSIISLLLLLLSSCSAYKIDMGEAKACAEGYLQAFQKGDFTAASTYYSDRFNETESPERRVDKMKKLKETMGGIVSYNIVDSVEVKKGAEIPFIKLTYNVQHTDVVAKYSFTIQKDAGKYKIILQNVETDF